MVKINTAYCPENLFNEALTAEEMVHLIDCKKFGATMRRMKLFFVITKL